MKTGTAILAGVALLVAYELFSKKSSSSSGSSSSGSSGSSSSGGTTTTPASPPSTVSQIVSGVEALAPDLQKYLGRSSSTTPSSSSSS